jgi:hypothetical protein
LSRWALSGLVVDNTQDRPASMLFYEIDRTA